MNRLDIRHARTIATLAAGGLLGAAALTGCSAGQIAQTAEQDAAVNGNATAINNMKLRDVHIQAAQTKDYLEPGQSVDLVLVVVNGSPDFADKLVGITTDVGTVTVSGNSEVPADGLLMVGARKGQNRKAADAVDVASNARATVKLSKPITNGLNYTFTFDFEKAGSGSLSVPIAAPSLQP